MARLISLFVLLLWSFSLSNAGTENPQQCARFDDQIPEVYKVDEKCPPTEDFGWRVVMLSGFRSKPPGFQWDAGFISFLRHNLSRKTLIYILDVFYREVYSVHLPGDPPATPEFQTDFGQPIELGDVVIRKSSFQIFEAFRKFHINAHFIRGTAALDQLIEHYGTLLFFPRFNILFPGYEKKEAILYAYGTLDYVVDPKTFFKPLPPASTGLIKNCNPSPLLKKKFFWLANWTQSQGQLQFFTKVDINLLKKCSFIFSGSDQDPAYKERVLDFLRKNEIEFREANSASTKWSEEMRTSIAESDAVIYMPTRPTSLPSVLTYASYFNIPFFVSSSVSFHPSMCPFTISASLYSPSDQFRTFLSTDFKYEPWKWSQVYMKEATAYRSLLCKTYAAYTAAEVFKSTVNDSPLFEDNGKYVPIIQREESVFRPEYNYQREGEEGEEGGGDGEEKREGDEEGGEEGGGGGE